MQPKIGIGEYRKKDYQEILKLSEDRQDMNATWEAWKKKRAEAINNFKKLGITTIDILVTPEELVNYCREKGLKINGAARAEYVRYKVTQLN